jgi:hypothetical protein
LYDVQLPDVIDPQSGAQAALMYVGGNGGNAAIQVAGTDGRGNVVVLGFPFETITSAETRAAMMGRVFEFFELQVVPEPSTAALLGLGAGGMLIGRMGRTSVRP